MPTTAMVRKAGDRNRSRQCCLAKRRRAANVHRSKKLEPMGFTSHPLNGTVMHVSLLDARSLVSRDGGAKCPKGRLRTPDGCLSIKSIRGRNAIFALYSAVDAALSRVADISTIGIYDDIRSSAHFSLCSYIHGIAFPDGWRQRSRDLVTSKGSSADLPDNYRLSIAYGLGNERGRRYRSWKRDWRKDPERFGTRHAMGKSGRRS